MCFGDGEKSRVSGLGLRAVVYGGLRKLKVWGVIIRNTLWWLPFSNKQEHPSLRAMQSHLLSTHEAIFPLLMQNLLRIFTPQANMGPEKGL